MAQSRTSVPPQPDVRITGYRVPQQLRLYGGTRYAGSGPCYPKSRSRCAGATPIDDQCAITDETRNRT